MRGYGGKGLPVNGTPKLANQAFFFCVFFTDRWCCAGGVESGENEEIGCNNDGVEEHLAVEKIQLRVIYFRVGCVWLLS